MCPGVFVFRENDIEIIYKGEDSIDKKNDKKLTDDLEMAEMNCPTKAIKIEEK